MNPHFLGDFLNHQRTQRIGSLFQELDLAAHDGLADFQNGLASLLNIANQLQG